MGLGGPEPREGRHRPDDRRRDARRRDDAHRGQRRGALRGGRTTRSASEGAGAGGAAARAERCQRGSGQRQLQTTRGDRSAALYDLLPADHRMSYDMHAVLACLVDDGIARRVPAAISRKEMICGDARIEGIQVGVIANQRGLIKGRAGREAAVRRDHLRRERREGRRTSSTAASRAGMPIAVRAGRLRLHGRDPKPSTSGIIRAGRALRRSDGDRACRRRSCSP